MTLTPTTLSCWRLLIEGALKLFCAEMVMPGFYATILFGFLGTSLHCPGETNQIADMPSK